ncbi:NAD-dependent epimerase/dehydratase family protein [Shewanella sp. SM23]|uniref:NAD-dependent epimerase/dehydratase family protein n=1 Tax=Shewanella sp. SM23 TaxID=2912794 RepID=UPI0021D7D2A0|nr:NAD-dependent epimerase/dehydratase family protein [Shewanella sp. SM23]MCU8082682.1 NAD-dependent epimerase/dehydratase family protein [Shewanella sp. SM23]
MSILVTGATGFIGKELNLKVECRSVLRGCSSESDEKCFFIEQLDGVTSWNNAFVGIESVIHLAGLAHSDTFTLSDYRTVNVEGTLHFAREAAEAGVKRFVFVSSIGVNGFVSNCRPFTSAAKPMPHSDYAQSKYEAEIGLINISEETGLEVVIVRPTLVYGVNAPGNFGRLTKLVQKFTFLPFGLVNNKRDFIAVQNLVDLLILCARHPNAAGHIFLASDGETVSIKEFTNAIAKGLGKIVIQCPVPISLMKATSKVLGRSAMIYQLFSNLEVDSSNTKEVLGWSPPYTMEQAMASLSENKK